VSKDRELLRRSMDAAPEEWMDNLVAARVMAEVEGQCSAPTRGRPPSSRRGALLDWLRALGALVARLRALIESVHTPRPTAREARGGGS
jgi:hypothetical protein